MTCAATRGQAYCSAAAAGARPRRSSRARVEREVVQRLGERERVAGRHQQAVAAVLDDVAVAGDVRRHHGRAGRERLGQHHPERLAAQRRRAEDVARASAARFSASSTRPERGHAARVVEQRREVPAPAPITVRRAGTCSRSASNARSSTGRPLRLTAWPTNAISSGSPGARRARRGRAPGGQHDAVGHDPVLAAEEAARRPGGGLGDRDPHVQAVEVAAGAPQRGDARAARRARCSVWKVPTSGESATAQRDPARGRARRLVHVNDVEAPVRSSRRSVAAANGVARGSRRAPLNGRPSVRPSETSHRASRARAHAAVQAVAGRGRTARGPARRGLRPATPRTAPRCGA